MENVIYAQDSFLVMKALFEVHNNLGKGFSEIVYKDAIAHEFKLLKIPFEREKEYSVHYKDVVLDHKFYADFILYNKIVLEIKSCESIHSNHISQCLNYLKVSDNKLAILANFNKISLEYKRIVI
ncbi:GxxExxY protein [Flavobacterium sp.]|uniref:GxxExxY protein n=1 Tax=Flavobacterium sp. TaxID=239 RepID=UPI0039E6F477